MEPEQILRLFEASEDAFAIGWQGSITSEVSWLPQVSIHQGTNSCRTVRKHPGSFFLLVIVLQRKRTRKSRICMSNRSYLRYIYANLPWNYSRDRKSAKYAIGFNNKTVYQMKIKTSVQGIHKHPFFPLQRIDQGIYPPFKYLLILSLPSTQTRNHAAP